MLHISFLRGAVIAVFLLTLFSSCQTTPEKTDSQTNMFVLRYNTILDQYGKKPADSLLQEIRLFLADYPSDAKSWVFLGRLYFDLDRMDSALICYRRAVELNPSIPGGYSSIACAFSLSGQLDSADIHFQNAFSSGDTSHFTRLSYIMLQLASDKLLDSTSLLSITEKKEDSTASYFVRKAYCLFRMKDFRRSDEAFQTARQVGFTDTLAYRSLIMDSISLEEFCRLTRL